MTAVQLQQKFPKLNFAAADNFLWSPKKQVVYYDPQRLSSQQGLMALLHEVGHALLGHRTYELDIELLDMEVEAWIKARQLAKVYSINLDEDHIDACLETYRIWLYKRSRCPVCGNSCLQSSVQLYRCFLCNAQWQVASSRSTQPRRMNLHIIDKEPV